MISFPIANTVMKTEAVVLTIVAALAPLVHILLVADLELDDRIRHDGPND
jgi:hypothetical protein